jgi:hypothetical protein
MPRRGCQDLGGAARRKTPGIGVSRPGIAVNQTTTTSRLDNDHEPNERDSVRGRFWKGAGTSYR